MTFGTTYVYGIHTIFTDLKYRLYTYVIIQKLGVVIK